MKGMCSSVLKKDDARLTVHGPVNGHGALQQVKYSSLSESKYGTCVKLLNWSVINFNKIYYGLPKS